jgi:hypothetical protein
VELVALVHAGVVAQCAIGEHAAQTVSAVGEHAVLTNWPAGHVLQLAHTALLVAVQALLAYWPAPHVAHVEQTVSLVAVHALLAYLPDPHVVQLEHPLVVPVHAVETKNWPAVQLVDEHATHAPPDVKYPALHAAQLGPV